MNDESEFMYAPAVDLLDMFSFYLVVRDSNWDILGAGVLEVMAFEGERVIKELQKANINGLSCDLASDLEEKAIEYPILTQWLKDLDVDNPYTLFRSIDTIEVISALRFPLDSMGRPYRIFDERERRIEGQI